MNHGRKDEFQRSGAKLERIAVRNDKHALGGLFPKIGCKNRLRFNVAHKFCVRIPVYKLGNGSAVIRFHMIDDDIIQLAAVKSQRELL